VDPLLKPQWDPVAIPGASRVDPWWILGFHGGCCNRGLCNSGILVIPQWNHGDFPVDPWFPWRLLQTGLCNSLHGNV